MDSIDLFQTHQPVLPISEVCLTDKPTPITSQVTAISNNVVHNCSARLGHLLNKCLLLLSKTLGLDFSHSNISHSCNICPLSK